MLTCVFINRLLYCNIRILQLYTFLEDLMHKQEKQRGQPGGVATRPAVARMANDRVPPECHTCTACASTAPSVPPWPGRQDRRKPAASRCETAGTGVPNAV